MVLIIQNHIIHKQVSISLLKWLEVTNQCVECKIKLLKYYSNSIENNFILLEGKKKVCLAKRIQLYNAWSHFPHYSNLKDLLYNFRLEINCSRTVNGEN